MAGDRNIAQLQALARAFNTNDLLILRGFIENRDFKVTYGQLAGALAGGLDPDILAALAGNGGTPDADNKYVTEEGLTTILNSIELPSGRRLISSQLVVTGDTSGILNASWISGTGVSRVLTEEVVTFPALPGAGNFRWDLVELYDDGSFQVKSQDPAASEAIRPTPTADTLIGGEAIFNEDGAVEQPGAPGQPQTNTWSGLRLQTETAPDTEGKYAKLWEGALSISNNYAIIIAYNDPKNASTFAGSGAGILKVSWTCNASRNIIPDTVKFVTDGKSDPGEFRLVQIAGNRAALYHKGSHFWSRIDYRVVFQSSAVRLQDFVNNAAYGAAPNAVATYNSRVAGEWQERESNTVLFDQKYIIGNADARTGNILFDFTGAKLGAETQMRHADASAFEFPDEAMLMFDKEDISTTEDNYFLFVLTKKSSPQIVKVFHALEGGL